MFFNATVDTGSPASFVNRRTADTLVNFVPSAHILDEQDCPIDTVYVDYKRRRVELFGTLVVDVLFLDWNVKSAKNPGVAEPHPMSARFGPSVPIKTNNAN